LYSSSLEALSFSKLAKIFLLSMISRSIFFIRMERSNSSFSFSILVVNYLIRTCFSVAFFMDYSLALVISLVPVMSLNRSSSFDGVFREKIFVLIDDCLFAEF
jgi:hypothetical protein